MIYDQFYGMFPEVRITCSTLFPDGGCRQTQAIFSRRRGEGGNSILVDTTISPSGNIERNAQVFIDKPRKWRSFGSIAPQPTTKVVKKRPVVGDVEMRAGAKRLKETRLDGEDALSQLIREIGEKHGVRGMTFLQQDERIKWMEFHVSRLQQTFFHEVTGKGEAYQLGYEPAVGLNASRWDGTCSIESGIDLMSNFGTGLCDDVDLNFNFQC